MRENNLYSRQKNQIKSVRSLLLLFLFLLRCNLLYVHAAQGDFKCVSIKTNTNMWAASFPYARIVFTLS